MLPVCLNDKIFETIENYYSSAVDQPKKDSRRTLALGLYTYMYHESRKLQDYGIKSSPKKLSKVLGKGYGERAVSQLVNDLVKMGLLSKNQTYNEERGRGYLYYNVKYKWGEESINKINDPATDSKRFLFKKIFLSKYYSKENPLTIQDDVIRLPMHNEMTEMADPKLYFEENLLKAIGEVEYKDELISDYEYIISRDKVATIMDMMLQKTNEGRILLQTINEMLE